MIKTDSYGWKKLRKQILERDNNTCRFCGVKCSKYMICDHIDGNPSNNNPDNLGINCKLCDSVRHCGFAGINNILYLAISNMAQEDINIKTLQLFEQIFTLPSLFDVDKEAILIADNTVSYANKLLNIADSFDYTSECDCYPISHTYDMHKGFFRKESFAMLPTVYSLEYGDR